MNVTVWSTSKGSPSQIQGPLHWRGKSKRFLWNSICTLSFICLIYRVGSRPTCASFETFSRICQSRQSQIFSLNLSMSYSSTVERIYSKANAQLHLCSTRANKASHSDSLWRGNFLSSFEIPRNLWTSENLPHLKSISRAYRLFGYSLVSNLPL